MNWLMRHFANYLWDSTLGAELVSSGLPFADVGSKRYPSRVRMWYFCRSLPTSLTLIERQPRLGLACG